MINGRQGGRLAATMRRSPWERGQHRCRASGKGAGQPCFQPLGPLWCTTGPLYRGSDPETSPSLSPHQGCNRAHRELGAGVESSCLWGGGVLDSCVGEGVGKRSSQDEVRGHRGPGQPLSSSADHLRSLQPQAPHLFSGAKPRPPLLGC